MKHNKKAGILIILLLSGALIGGFIGEFASQYSLFRWMSLGGSNGYKELFSVNMNPLFDAHVIKFGFSLVMRINVGSIVGMILAIIIFLRMRRL